MPTDPSYSLLQNGADVQHWSSSANVADKPSQQTSSALGSPPFEVTSLSSDENIPLLSPTTTATSRPALSSPWRSPGHLEPTNSPSASPQHGRSEIDSPNTLQPHSSVVVEGSATSTTKSAIHSSLPVARNQIYSEASKMTTALATTTSMLPVYFPQQASYLDQRSPTPPRSNTERFDIFIYGDRQQPGRRTSATNTSSLMHRDSSLPRSYDDAGTPAAAHIIALPPFSSPTSSPRERPSTPTLHTGNSRVGHSTDERFRYQSWRKGLPVLGGRLTNKVDRPNALVDKKIEATLPRSEQTVVARSRKTSHILGIFSRNKAPKEQHTSTAPSEQNSNCAPAEALSKDSLAKVEESDPIVTLLHKLDSSCRTVDALPSRSRYGVFAANELPSSATDPTGQSKSEPPVSPREILDMGSSKPVIRRDSIDQLANVHDPTVVFECCAKNNDTTNEGPMPECASRNEAGPQGSLTDEEEVELVQKEHISSAVYYPHRSAEQVQISSNPNFNRDNTELSMLDQTPTRSYDTYENGKTKSSNYIKAEREIEFTLQSEDESHRFHGELTEDDSTSEDGDNAGQSSESSADFATSESEIDENDDASQGDDLSGAQTPRAGMSFIRSRRAPQAIELKPFDHQVGGHTALYRFSDRAVCKKLNNKENKFYETVERFHPELLDFLPRYIGVLNVTFEKTTHRKKSLRSQSRPQALENEGPTSLKESEGDKSSLAESKTSISSHNRHSLEKQRLVSHSQQILPIPEVYVNMNRHIIPDDLFCESSSRRLPTLPGQLRRWSEIPPSQENTSTEKVKSRISSVNCGRPVDDESGSWGATIINSRLQAQVMREVFAPTPIHSRRRTRRVNHRLSRTESEANKQLTLNRITSDVSDGFHSKLRSSLDEAYLSDDISAMDTFKERAIRAEDEGDSLKSPLQLDAESSNEKIGSLAKDIIVARDPTFRRVPRRRASGSGLVSKQKDVNSGKRSDLQFFDEDNYSGDAEDELFSMDTDSGVSRSSSSSSVAHGSTKPDSGDTSLLTTPRQLSTKRRDTPSGMMLPGPLRERVPSVDNGTVPLNPKEAALEANQRVDEFLLLEDLTSGMSKPCTLDLKMGTRQYGLDADEKKQMSQRSKCKMTTSYELGVRVCGMQTWDITNKQFIWQDKYYGRDLRVGADFQRALKSFFFNGVDYLAAKRNIPIALQKISALEKMVCNLPGYRFYGSSLYIIYDGGEDEDVRAAHAARHAPHRRTEEVTSGDDQPQRREILVKIIDFANCVTKETTNIQNVACPPSNPDDIDRGYLTGLKSLTLYFKNIWKELNEADWREPIPSKQTVNQQAVVTHDKNDVPSSASSYEDDDSGQISV